MSQICRCFRSRRNAEFIRHPTIPQTSQLRKYEPHPVGQLLSAPQLGAYLLKNRFLRPNESLKLKVVVHSHTMRFRSNA